MFNGLQQSGNRKGGIFRAGCGAALLCCAALFSLISAQVTPVSVHGKLSIKGNRFVDKNGVPVTLHGMSMYAWASQGLQYYNATAVGRLCKEWKCTAIRIPILPGRVSSQEAQLKTVVDACIANGVYAIIDWHSMGGANAQACSNFMVRMATAYGNTPNVMYEPWNEPVGESWTTIKAYMETVIKAIRAVDPDNIIICGNPRWDQCPDQAAANPITVSTNIAYSFHFYAATHRVAGMGGAVRTALSKGCALFSTEYGTSQATGNGPIDLAETQKWYALLDSNGVGSTNWSVSALGETSAAFNPGTSATNWTDANLKPSGAFVKAYIMSKYDRTVGVLPSAFNPALFGRSGKESPSFMKSAANFRTVFSLNGQRLSGREGEIPAMGCHILGGSGVGSGVRSKAIVRIFKR